MQATATLHAVDSSRRIHGVEMDDRNAPSTVDAAPCSTCPMHGLCLPASLGAQEVRQFAELIRPHRSVKRHQHLYHAGSPFRSLYAIRAGSLKSSLVDDGGREQVTGFHMAGELVGMDALEAERHLCNAVALEDTSVCEIPFAGLNRLADEMPALRRSLHRAMGREIARDYHAMLVLGSMRAEERVAAFLLGISKRFAARGYSAFQFNLRMTREEIASYLGLKFETVSRALSQFQEDRLIAVNNKAVEIRDHNRLQQVVCNDGEAWTGKLKSA